MKEVIEQNGEILKEHQLSKMGGVPVSANFKLGIRYDGRSGKLQHQFFVQWKFEEPFEFGGAKVSEMADFVWLDVPTVKAEIEQSPETDIREISGEEAEDIIDSRQPPGLFLITPSECFCGCITAIDNSTGDAWTEEFESREKAIQWLRGDFEVEPLFPSQKCRTKNLLAERLEFAERHTE